MSDTRPYDEQLPWLQPVDDEDEPRGLSARKMLAALLVVLLAAAIVAATFFWLGRRDTVVNGPPELIRAPAAPYKVKPENPGGLNISAESETAFETSSGQDLNAQLDTSKLPNPPALKPEADQAKTLPGNETKTPVPAAEEPKAKPTGGAGSVIQLGAFANRTQAERAWTALSARFPAIAALNKMIVPYPGGMRLRAGAASPADAKQACDMLKAAGESCFIAR
ncbi:MAG TPA: SPOR domain-containing protein [Sphingomicrobium sp.]|nr:SPOR domain-containing protein [Sphingomicrobium sp.]